MRRLPISYLFALALTISAAAETLAPLQDGKAPQTHAELWAGFDPRVEPLDIEVLHEWEEEGVVFRVVRFRVGVFKGEKAMLAGVYGFPKGASDLPGLLNIHGGGQYADYKSVLTNAKRGYATITIAWAGRINAPDYRVSPSEVQLFWDRKADDPKYKVTTDWGALDAYHAPSRNGQDAFVSIRDGSEDWTIDAVPSPRNNSWFLCTMGARRALTFLEEQPEVDGERLGVYGHSMGGKLTVATAAADKRVKAAAPSCGGISDRYNTNPLHHATVGDSPALKELTCPTIFLKPANDFHSHVNNLVDAIDEIGDTEWRVTCSAHLNHRDYPENEAATQLWFDQHLKGEFEWPKTPETDLQLKTEDGIPSISVRPDSSRTILGVEVYCTQQGLVGKEHHINRINQFWHYAPCEQKDEKWTAKLPLYALDKPIWVYANVIYKLDEPVSGAGYYYGPYSTEKISLSSLIQIIEPQQLQEAGVKATLQATTSIESFEGDWRKEWFQYGNDGWGIRTHKVYHPIWKAPDGEVLSIEVKAEQANKLVIGLDEHVAEVEIAGGGEWETVKLGLSDFQSFEESALQNWDELLELRILPTEHLRASGRGQRESRLVGANWKGAPPEFRDLRWKLK
ncbi:MAG: acetylxylan esterase [Verrucomicrobiota bacterium]